MIPAIAAAVAIPLTFLYLIRWLDLYASGSFRTVLLCLAWGAAAFFGALQVNSYDGKIVRGGTVSTEVPETRLGLEFRLLGRPQLLLNGADIVAEIGAKPLAPNSVCPPLSRRRCCTR